MNDNHNSKEVINMSDINNNGSKPAKKDCCACSEKHKERSPEEYKDLINRLSRIEGQVRGIKAMVEKGAYCPDILIQTSAVNSALNSFSKVLLSNHIRTCVRNDIKDGNDEVVEELVATLQKMMK
ncbi:MAG: metal-sensing transcriptional repressor [Mogibacterium sp.]|nr:metal-sensing transcriptional repressor [Mogibacterium sp.]